MCGIVGILSWARGRAEREATTRRLGETLGHRGPDGEAYASLDACSLGLRRLSIVDLESPAHVFASEDRSVLAVANAEIYNAPELRERLGGLGHAFSTRIDTEVLPHLYEERGADLVGRLRGMFAVAIWDRRRERLLLGRDRAGEKPLFYWQGADELVFASELRALLAHPRIAPAVDARALSRYLLHDFFPAPWTPLAGVHKLPAGHLLLAGRQGLTVRKYWDAADHVNTGDLSRRDARSLAAELDERLATAVRRRRQADTRVGVFLSGGLDSTAVLSHLSEQVGPGVPAFAIGHADPEFDESRFAADTARFFGAELHPLVLGEADLADGLRRVAEGFDEPLGDASTIPTHLLARFARQQVKVVLSGEGADELFAGYPTYIGHRLGSHYRRLPAALRRGLLVAAGWLPNSMGNVSPGYLVRRFALGADSDPIERHHLWFGSIGPDLQRQVVAPGIVEALREDDPWSDARRRAGACRWPDGLDQHLYTDFSMYLQDDLLTKIDRATMLASLESRAPYLDTDLMEFAAGIPARHKLSGFSTKAVLRRAVRHRVPKAVLTRRKRGFNIPFSRWLLHGFGEQLRERFSQDRVAARGLLCAEGVNRLLDEHLSRQCDHRKPLFNLLALDLWCDRVFGEGAPVPVEAATRVAEPVGSGVR
jgi:asparagine synthase (glutamine-hydrolysing)